MNFELTEEQNLIRDMVRQFAETEVAPSAADRDEQEHFDRDLMFARLADLGLTGIVFPEEYGGAGADYLSYAIAVEELSRVCASTGVTLSAHLSLGSNPIYLFGTDEQKEKFLTPLAQGTAMGAFGLTEPAAGSDAGGTKTTAVRDGDDWILNGTKIFITNAGEADIYVVFARTDKEAQKHHGISAFIVEKGTPGFSFGKKEKKMGIRSSPTMELVFENCRIPARQPARRGGQGLQGGDEDPRRRPYRHRLAGPRHRPGRPRRDRRLCHPERSSSTSRSAPSRGCSSSSPTWRPRSRRHGC